MSKWRTLKATIVGLHADYYTQFSRLKEKYQRDENTSPPVRPAPILTGETLKTLVHEDRTSDVWGPSHMRRRRNLKISPSDSPYTGMPYSTGSTSTRTLSQLSEHGWADIAVIASMDGFRFQGTYGNEFGEFEAVIDNKGNVLEVKTHSAIRSFPEREV